MTCLRSASTRLRFSIAFWRLEVGESGCKTPENLKVDGSTYPSAAQSGRGISHLACILRSLPGNCREQGWLLKNSVFLKKVENRVIENVQERSSTNDFSP